MRKTIHFIFVCALIVGAILASSVITAGKVHAQPAENYWVQYQGNARHTGQSPYSGPKSDVHVKWTFPVDMGISSPVIGPDGTIYALGKSAKTLYAINPDGSEKWSTYVGTYSWGTPAIDSDGTIYFNGLTSNRLHAVDKDGQLVWTFKIDDYHLQPWGFLNSPVLGDDGTIYIAGTGGDIYALDKHGNILWKNNVHGYDDDGDSKWRMNFFQESSVAVGQGEDVYVQCFSLFGYGFPLKGYLFALNKASGAVSWALPFDDPSQHTATIADDGTIYTVADNGHNLYAISPSGSILWSLPVDAGNMLSVAYASKDNSLYIKSSVEINKLDAATGSVLWTHKVMQWGIIYTSDPLVDADGASYIGTGNGDPLNNYSVFAVDNGGNRLWRISIGTTIRNSGALGPDGTLYIGSSRLYAIAEKNTPPLADAGPDRTVEFASCDGAAVILDGSASYDPDGDPITYAWSWEGGTASGSNPSVTLPYGTTDLTLTVTDDKGASDTDTVVITVADTIAPELGVTLDPDVLWPPDHEHRTITPSFIVQDACVSAVSVQLQSVSSNEPDNGTADGDTTDDIVVNDDGTISLRAERSGDGNGRIYTITYMAVDGAGNSTVSTATVSVPKSRK